MNPDPNQVITPMVAGTLSLLNAAAKQPAVKRFVLTSSCTSAASQKPGVGLTINEKTWNDEVAREAWAPPPYGAERGFAVYSASKMEMERAAWKWHEEHNPHFVLNTGQSSGTRLISVLLLTNVSSSPQHEHGQKPGPGRPRPPLDILHDSGPVPGQLGRGRGSSPMYAALPTRFSTNRHSTNLGKPLDFFVDVQDNARLHVAALIHPEVQGERIFAYASPFTWRGIQRIMQKLYPGKSFPRDIDEAELDKSDIVRAPRAEALLRDMGRPGWTSLEETVRLNTEDLA